MCSTLKEFLSFFLAPSLVEILCHSSNPLVNATTSIFILRGQASSWTRNQRQESPLWRPRKWAVLGADWFWLWLWFWFVSWPIGECTAWQLGRQEGSLQFLEALSMALPLQLILAFWHLRFLFGGYQRRILLVLFFFLYPSIPRYAGAR